MSIPQPPQDISLMNTIDKLAQFVVRNGEEFEKMTLQKQINNSRFNFLRPGEEFYDYYQYKLMECRRSLLSEFDMKLMYFIIINQHPVNPEQQQQQQQHPVNPIAQNSNPWNSNGSQQQGNLATQIEAINTQQNRLREQILQSEKNLQAQHQVLTSNILHHHEIMRKKFYR